MPVLMEDGVDSGLVWHYGNPVTEARALAAGEGIVGLGNRDVFELTGVDRLNLLHALSTQHVEALPADEATCALLLGPTGHIEHVLYGVDDGESFLGWTEPGRGDAMTHARLSLMGHAVPAGPDPERRARWLARDPKATVYIDLPDFRFWRITPLSGLLNAGFGRAFRLTAQDMLKPPAE